jgi:hypothetical protein
MNPSMLDAMNLHPRSGGGTSLDGNPTWSGSQNAKLGALEEAYFQDNMIHIFA